MLRSYTYPLLALILLCSASLLSSCKSKSKEDSKRDLLEAIAHYKVDTIDVTDKEPLGSPDVDEILRHYPEFYHATERTQKAFAKWAQTEYEMVQCVFVGKDKARRAKAQRNEASFRQHLEAYSVGQMLDYVLLDNDELPAEPFSDNEQTSQLYLNIMATVADGLAEDARHAKSDDMKSAVGYARRAWKDYLAELQQMTDAVPESARARYIKAVNDMMRQHLIDLTNRYYSFFTGEHPAWLLGPDATDDAIDNFQFIGLHDCPWIESN